MQDRKHLKSQTHREHRRNPKTEITSGKHRKTNILRHMEKTYKSEHWYSSETAEHCQVRRNMKTGNLENSETSENIRNLRIKS